MGKRLNIAGKRFGKLFVIELCGSINGRSFWSCVCDCGNYKKVRGSDLVNQKSQSCGCLKNELDKPDRNRQLLETLYSKMKRNAIRRGLEFSLKIGLFENLISQNCFYCDSTPKTIWRDEVNKKIISGSELRYNGLDRVDSDRGYTIDNVVPCCIICNRMKMDSDFYSFLDHIKQIYRNHNPLLNKIIELNIGVRNES